MRRAGCTPKRSNDAGGVMLGESAPCAAQSVRLRRSAVLTPGRPTVSAVELSSAFVALALYLAGAETPFESFSPLGHIFDQIAPDARRDDEAC
jgi:hypothetical protein